MSEYIIDTDGIRQLVSSTVTATLNSWFMRNEYEEFTFPMLPKIVRCRDCRHYERDACCELFVFADDRISHVYEPDGFCAWGERREP